MKQKFLSNIIKAVIVLIAAMLMLILAYAAYMQMHYYRIEDNLNLETVNNQDKQLKIGTDYTAVTYNTGFGAYNPEFTFFMDTGTMLDGTKVQGYHGTAESRETVIENMNGSMKEMKALEADFYLLQEVDVNATRSFQINQKELWEADFEGYGSTFANNFHSAFLFYPFYEPHGKVEAGLQTLSKYKINQAVRRSYPVDNSFVTKFTDLDRCFMIQRIPVQNGKELIFINNHMSAYDKGGLIRIQQLELLNLVLEEEREKGNYVIVGGDFNHALYHTKDAFKSEQQQPDWVNELNNEDIPEGYQIVEAKNAFETATCRGADIPYQKGINYTTVVDGFIVSDNISAEAENINLEFLYSDHNPVKLTFKLKE